MANSDLLDVDAGALEAASVEFLACANNTQDTMTRIRNQTNNLQSSFHGQAADTMYSKVDQMATLLQTQCDHITEMSNDLKNLAAKVRQLQAEAASAFSNIG